MQHFVVDVDSHEVDVDDVYQFIVGIDYEYAPNSAMFFPTGSTIRILRILADGFRVEIEDRPELPSMRITKLAFNSLLQKGYLCLLSQNHHHTNHFSDEPKNNDGRETCFKCGSPTKLIDTGLPATRMFRCSIGSCGK